MNYAQLTEEDRIEIYAMKKAGVQQNEIANQIGCHPNTISNELRRNAGQRGYDRTQPTGRYEPYDAVNTRALWNAR